MRKPAIELTPSNMRREHSVREKISRFTDLHNYEIEKNMKGMGKPSKGKPRQVKQAVKIEKRIAAKSKTYQPRRRGGMGGKGR